MSNRKRVLICSHWLEMGGAERALIGLLEALSDSEHEIDLFLCRHTGEFMKDIPKGVNFLPEESSYAVLAVSIWSAIRKRQFAIVLGRIYGKLRAILYIRKRHLVGECAVGQEYGHKYTKWASPKVGVGIYDLAVSFLSPHYIVSEKVCAKKKIAWIHTDYTTIQIDTESELKMWSAYDYIASISEDVTKGFVTKFPSLADKVVLIENILPKTLIEKQAQEEPDSDFKADGRITLLSIGRFCSAKNFDNVPDICRRLVELGCDVNWYLIGYGQDEGLIRQKIEEAGMQDRVIILGKKENPYPYINACDLYVQPSRYEGKCVAVREAQMLGKPVVITDYPTAGSQLENGVDGVVVPQDNEKCAEGIANLLSAPQEMKQLVKNCKKNDYTNSQEVNKIYEMME